VLNRSALRLILISSPLVGRKYCWTIFASKLERQTKLALNILSTSSNGAVAKFTAIAMVDEVAAE